MNEQEKLAKKIEIQHAEIKLLKLLIEVLEQGLNKIISAMEAEQQRDFESSVPEDEL